MSRTESPRASIWTRFRSKDYGATTRKATTLDANEFIRRFLGDASRLRQLGRCPCRCHTPPKGFRRIRHFAIWQAPAASASWHRIRSALNVAEQAPAVERADYRERIATHRESHRLLSSLRRPYDRDRSLVALARHAKPATPL